MNAGATAVVAKADLLKWWDALDDLLLRRIAYRANELFLGALLKARESQHPDARWLVSLLPTEGAVTAASLREVMMKQEDDPRGMYIAWVLGDRRSRELLTRAAEKGYAPAQALLSMLDDDKARYEWAQRAADQGDRCGLFSLGVCYELAYGCRQDIDKAAEMYGKAAELECVESARRYGDFGFGHLDWERYHWWGFAVARGHDRSAFGNALFGLVPSFERGENGRILHTAAPVIRGFLSGPRELGDYERERFEQMIELHDAMLGRARRAIDCWSVAGRRLRLVKDMRVMIAKTAWAEAWRWMKSDIPGHRNNQTKTKNNVE
jgi:hypothetical protein